MFNRLENLNYSKESVNRLKFYLTVSQEKVAHRGKLLSSNNVSVTPRSNIKSMFYDPNLINITSTSQSNISTTSASSKVKTAALKNK